MLAGVDGCRGGWVVALAPTWPGAIRLEIAKNFSAVLELTAKCRVVAVDMPIGLPTGATRRACDRAAREALGARSSSVFFAPPRAALAAENPLEFQAIHRQLFGKGASIPLWGIVPKIREVDALMTPSLQERVVEAHPELVWRRLAGSDLPSKHRPEGIAARLECLRDVGVRSEPNSPIPGVKQDDMLDAIALLACASARLDGTGVRYPAAFEERDEKGLLMEMWS
ncbi:MAG: DUF429 domain-containing protein [Fimbriimonadaceae bacterium]|nr:DUF429 domain-containing protein [Fimbriimonadaceae bacterium]